MQLKNCNQNWNVHFKMATCLKNVSARTTSPPPISPELLSCSEHGRRPLQVSCWLARAISIHDSNGTELGGEQATRIQEQQIPGCLHQLPSAHKLRHLNIVIEKCFYNKKSTVPELHGLVPRIQAMKETHECWSSAVGPFPCPSSQAPGSLWS